MVVVFLYMVTSEVTVTDAMAGDAAELLWLRTDNTSRDDVDVVKVISVVDAAGFCMDDGEVDVKFWNAGSCDEGKAGVMTRGAIELLTLRTVDKFREDADPIEAGDVAGVLVIGFSEVALVWNAVIGWGEVVEMLGEEREV